MTDSSVLTGHNVRWKDVELKAIEPDGKTITHSALDLLALLKLRELASHYNIARFYEQPGESKISLAKAMCLDEGGPSWGLEYEDVSPPLDISLQKKCLQRIEVS